MKIKDPTKIISNSFKALPFHMQQKRLREKILSELENHPDVVYGAQSIRKQIGIRGRPTYDFDIFSKNPKKRAIEFERKLEKLNPRADLFFVKKGKNYGTYKVKFKGNDMIPNTKDDVGIIDVTKSEGRIKFTVIDKIKYRKLVEELNAKIKILKDPNYKFRWKKDYQDYLTIKKYINTLRYKYI